MSQNICKKLALLTVATSALAVSACSTTSSATKVTQAAPITYKVGEGAMQYASVSTTLPRSTQLPMSAPTVAIPSPYSSPSPYAAQQPTAPQAIKPPSRSQPRVDNFDSKRVDRDLYKHQKVGNKYSVMGKSYTPKHDPKYNKKGLASWYGDKYHGKPTATGEIFDKNAMTAAHKTLPLNSMLHVTNLETGESILVRLNDRGPFVSGRIIDLSEAAARQLGVIQDGTARVRVRYAGPADPMAANRMVEAPSPSVPAPMPYQPVTPQPQYSAPAPQAATPQTTRPQAAAPQPDRYQPLRDHTPHEYAPAAPSAPAPQAVESAPTYTPPQYQQIEPQHMQPQAPTALTPDPPQGGEDDVITLTIKGPIHMAKHTTEKQATWIPAYNVTVTPK